MEGGIEATIRLSRGDVIAIIVVVLIVLGVPLLGVWKNH